MKMTSTPFSVGLSEESRLSSRVLRPPGGGHTDIFGSEPEPLRVGRRPGPNTAVPAPPKVEEAAEPTASVRPVPAPPKVEEAAEPTASASEPSQNGTCAPPPETPAVTPTEPAAEPKAAAPRPAPANPEPPRRVRVPPGGFSSGLW